MEVHRNSELNKEHVTVLIPTINEADGIGDTIEEVKRQGYTKIIVVDGGSTDGTIELARKLGAKVIMQEGKGKADAIKTGLKHVKTSFVAVMDGDYTYPAKYLNDLYKKLLEGYDEVIGVRIYRDGSQSLVFRVGNKILSLLFDVLLGTKLKDVLSGMYIIRVNAIRGMMFEMHGFSVESEIAAHIASTTQRIAEVPITYRRRKGKKKLGVRHGIKIALDIIRLAWRYNPAFTIFAVGSLLMIPGLALSIYSAYHYFFTGIKYYIKGLIGIILTLTGFQSSLLAIIAIYLKRAELRIIKRLESIERRE